MEPIPAEHRGVGAACVETVVLLAGGRGSRLGGVWKALLQHDGGTLLSAAVAAVAESLPRARIAVVGPEALRTPLDETAIGAGAVLTREEPPFAGPLAAVAAGLEAAAGPAGAGPAEAAGRPAAAGAGLTLLLAVDYVHPRAIVAALAAYAAELQGTEAAAGETRRVPDALVPLDVSGREQPLAALWRTSALRAALETAARPAPGAAGAGSLSARLADAPMRRITRAPGLRVHHWRTSEAHLFDDVDTWEDAAANGIGRGRA